MRRKKVVVIGGGTGTYQVLVGLKKYPVELSAVVTMSDSGGSSGRLRKEFSILPPGDVRRALLALSDLPIARKTLEKLFNYRFEEGVGLKGHSLGNLFLAALTQITGREDLAIKEAGKILDVSGYVYPVTLDKTNLVAELANGKKIFGETNIDLRWYGKKLANIPIKKVYLSPSAKIFPKVKDAIIAADLIVIGPGDLYTSLIPNLLVKGVNEALSKSKAKVVYISNLMTKPGETDGFKISNFLTELKGYMGEAGPKLTHAIVNTSFPNNVETLGWYKKFHSEPVKNDLLDDSVKVIEGSFVTKGEFLRHDPSKLARRIISLLD